MPLRPRLTALAALVMLAVCTALVPAFGVAPEGGDLDVFSAYAHRVAGGAVPYRDFGLEYPPGALAAIVPPGLGGVAEHTYAVRFVWAMLALLAVTIVLLARRPRAAFLVALSPLLLGPVTLKRFDALPALLTVAALLLARRRRFAWSGAALGVGAAVKLYPALLLPVLAIAAGRRAGARAVGAFVLACAAVFAPFVVLAPGGVATSIQDQLGRHLQLETPLASLALLAHSFGLVSVGLVSEAHTYGLGGASGVLLAAVTSVLFVAALVLVWRRTPQLVRTDRGLELAWAATLCVAVVLGRVLSPQYLVWLLPVVPLVGLGAALLLVAAVLVTNWWYPAHYLDAVVHGDRASLELLVLRNLLLVTLLLALLRRSGALRLRWRRARR